MTKPGAKKTARDRYGQHRESARIRNIPFLLTFEEWWDIWASSGCWDRRGTGPDRYCMARFLDKGTYEIGNVKICTNKENWDEQGPRKIP